MDPNEDTSKLPNDKVKNALDEIIKNNLGTEKYHVSVEMGSSKGDNYLGVVYRALAKPSTSAQKGSTVHGGANDLSIIIKVPPQNAARRKQFFARPCFLREAWAYDELLPLYMSFQESKGIVPTENGFHEVPECYKTLTEDEFEAIFLRDLKSDGFEMFNRFEKPTPEHVILVMKILAKFHAISYAINDQCPEKIEAYKDLEDIFTARKDEEGLNMFFNELKSRALASLNPQEDQLLEEKILKIFEGHTFMELMIDILEGGKNSPYAVVCHGDCWNNNVLFKNENGKPVDARLIDWQIARYTSPICDIMYYIFCCTTKDLRDAHYYKFIEVYYMELSRFIKQLGSDPEKVIPRKAFHEQLRTYGKFGLLMAMMVLPMFTSQAEDVPDLDELSEKMDSGELDVKTSFKSERTINVFQKRMRDVMVDQANYGYI